MIKNERKGRSLTAKRDAQDAGWIVRITFADGRTYKTWHGDDGKAHRLRADGRVGIRIDAPPTPKDEAEMRHWLRSWEG